MLTLADPAVHQQLRSRIERLTADAPRQWGSMNPHQMMCHLTDSFRLTMSEKDAGQIQNWFSRNIIKVVALYAPMAWPKGVDTRPEMDQKFGGTPPVQFEADKQLLLQYYDRFSRNPKDFIPPPHPIFGSMTANQWDRWAYLHMDHHLRQFNG